MSDNEAFALIISRLGEIHNDIGDLYKRVDGLLSKEDCEKCKEERDKAEEKKHGVSPRMAYIGVPILVAILYTIGQNLKYIWHAFVLLVRGG